MPQHHVDLRVLAQVCAGEDISQVAGHLIIIIMIIIIIIKVFIFSASIDSLGHLLDAEVGHHHRHCLILQGVHLPQHGAEQGAEGSQHLKYYLYYCII